MTKDVISLSISVLLLVRHYISHKITFGAPSSGGVLCSACGAFIKYMIFQRGQKALLWCKGLKASIACFFYFYIFYLFLKHACVILLI